MLIDEYSFWRIYWCQCGVEDTLDKRIAIISFGCAGDLYRIQLVRSYANAHGLYLQYQYNARSTHFRSATTILFWWFRLVACTALDFCWISAGFLIEILKGAKEFWLFYHVKEVAKWRVRHAFMSKYYIDVEFETVVSKIIDFSKCCSFINISILNQCNASCEVGISVYYWDRLLRCISLWRSENKTIHTTAAFAVVVWPRLFLVGQQPQ